MQRALSEEVKMRKEEIEELIRLVESSQINELEICEGRKKIRISKGAASAAAYIPAASFAPAAESGSNTVPSK